MKGLKKLLRWTKPYMGLVLITILLTFIIPATYSYVPQFIKYVIDVILKENFEGSITLPSFLINYFQSFENKITSVMVVGISLTVFQLFRGIMMFVNGFVKGKLAENMTYDMRENLYTHIQNLSYSYHNNVDAGDLIQRCTSDIDTIKTFLSTQLPEILYIVVSFTAGALQMAAINIRIMLVTLIIAPITLTGSIIFYKYVKKKFEIVEQTEANMTTILQENVNGVRVVKAFNAETDEINRFNIANEDVKDKNIKLNNGMALYWGLSDGVTFLQYAITITTCIIFARNGSVSTGDIIACMMYIGMLVWPIRNLGRIISDFGKATVASNRIDEILDIDDEYCVNGNKKPKIDGNIEFKDVVFKFDNTDKPLINGISFKIEKGQTIAFVGKTGSGKSTIANLLVRMLEYSEGKITLSGIDIKEIDKKHLRSNVGIILQDPFLYTKSIMENVKIGNKDIKEEEVYKSCAIASIHNDIESFEKGYDTLVGEKGVTLSGGQKQRLAIARMLVLNKPIIIFDDSLSAVDTKTDLKIRNSLREQKTDLTTLIITHRITTAKEADQIIVLEDGKISQIGTHEELSKRPGLYKQLWDIQGALEDEFLDYVKRGE